ncbi:hypothetical protein ScPMuIL_002941 [Solemya velum]
MSDVPQTNSANGAKSPEWRKIGSFVSLKKRICQHVYAETGKKNDLALFYNEGKFYAMEAWCSHMGGPLYLGDLEDYGGSCHVMCPWHSYMFDLTTGKNEIGLRQDVFQVKVESGDVYILHAAALSLNRYEGRSYSRTDSANMTRKDPCLAVQEPKLPEV